jgi:protein-tyrosine phosphatase
MAEYLLRPRLEHLPGWRGHVRSAGVNALIGQPADETTAALMRERGIDISEHRASQLLRQDLRQADLVLVMENHHREAVLHLDPTARGKTFLLGHWTNTEIPDPYRRGDQAHTQAMHLIDATMDSWLVKLVSHS